MAKMPEKTIDKKSHRMRRLIGRAVVAGATCAGDRMAASDAKAARPKKSHKMRKLAGVAMIVGAAYAAGKMISYRKKTIT